MTDPATPAATPPATPATPAVPKMTDPAKLLHRAPISRTLRPALMAIAIAWVFAVLFHIVYLIRDFLWIIHDGVEYVPEAFGDFVGGAILEPLTFFIGAGALLVFVLPILPETRLLKVMIRAAVASLGGFLLLSFWGFIQAIFDAMRFGFEFGYFLNDWIGYPLRVCIDLAPLLVIGAVVSWLFASKKAAAAA